MAGEVGLLLDGLHGGFDGSAIGVAEDEQKRGRELEGGVFEGGKAVVVEEISGNAHGENLAEGLIEDDFGSDAGVGAAEDGGHGRLSGSKAGAEAGGIAGAGFAGSEALIALEQAAEGLLGSEG